MKNNVQNVYYHEDVGNCDTCQTENNFYRTLNQALHNKGRGQRFLISDIVTCSLLLAKPIMTYVLRTDYD